MTTTQLLLILIGLTCVLLYAFWRNSNLRARHKELEKMIEERTSELKKQIAQAEKQKEIARVSEKYKEQFLANMSHEIRTPMNAISGITNILRRNDHPTEQDHYLEAISQSSENLLVILNDILDLSKIEAGKIKIDSVQMNPRHVVDGVSEILKFKAEHSGLTLETEVHENVPSHVMGDPVRLNQILVNLVGNGIKFTEEGGINVTVKKVIENENEVIRYAVKDTGIGVVDDKQSNIFGEYEQIDDEHGKQYAGTGLGLSVTKQLVELQNGTIWLESKTGVGSTFFFDMPVVPVQGEVMPDPYITEEEMKEITEALRGVRVLLAEDNEFNIMVATDDLAYYIPEINVETAKTGDQALQKYLSGSYDIILMDIQMPIMNGYEATQEIRKWESKQASVKATPVIAMTASLLRSEIIKCFEAGMNNFVPKPYKIEELIGSIYTEAMKSGFMKK